MKLSRIALVKLICRYLPPIISQRVRSILYPINLSYNNDDIFIVNSQTGSKFKGRISDYHGYYFCFHGYFDWRNWAICLALISQGDSIIEIGANVGTETVGFSDIVGFQGKVYAFEPLPSNLAELKETVMLCHFQNVVIMPYALSNEIRIEKFVTPISKNTSGVGHIIGPREESLSNIIDIINQCIK